MHRSPDLAFRVVGISKLKDLQSVGRYGRFGNGQEFIKGSTGNPQCHIGFINIVRFQPRSAVAEMIEVFAIRQDNPDAGTGFQRTGSFQRERVFLKKLLQP